MTVLRGAVGFCISNLSVAPDIGIILSELVLNLNNIFWSIVVVLLITIGTLFCFRSQKRYQI